METVWAGQITPAKDRAINDTQYTDNEIQLTQGQEMGRFNMGSTVILIFPNEVANNSYMKLLNISIKYVLTLPKPKIIRSD